MAAPFFPFPVDHPAGALVEIPLNFMDTLFANSGKDVEAMKRRVTESYLYAKAAGGLYSTLVHPSNMPADEMPGLEQFYQSLLLRFRMDGACSLTGAELTGRIKCTPPGYSASPEARQPSPDEHGRH